MKKRNKPILLATLLIVFVGAAVAMNAMMLPPSGNEPPKPAEQPKDDHKDESPLGNSRKIDNSKSAKAAAAQLAAKNKAPKKPAINAPGPNDRPKMSIVRSKASDYKPVPNESMTSAHWWTDDYGYKGPKKGTASSGE
ncbi:MAG: hypothetical protein ACAH95_15370 [Fimbriimonas sp.]